MHTEPDRDFFLLTAIEWAALRAASQRGGRAAHIASVISREAAYCHLLFQQGRHAVVLRQVRAVCEHVLGVHLPAGESGRVNPDAARTLAVAADLFHRLRLAAVASFRVGAA